MSQYFPKTFRSFGGNINVKVDLSNYATKTDLKNVTHVDTSSFALRTNLVNVKTEVDKPVLVDLSKLIDVNLILNCRILTKKLLKLKQNACLLKMN